MWPELRERIAKWYQGTYVPPPPNDLNSSLVLISAGHYEQPALAKVLHRLAIFWDDHWKWVSGGIAGAIWVAVWKAIS